jgi:PAS domain S-box-containing protein
LSHYISKITVKILLVCLLGMLMLTAYFIISAHFSSIKNTETLELTRIQGVVKTLALQLESTGTNRTSPDGSKSPSSIESEQRLVSQNLLNVTILNKLESGLSVVLTNTESGKTAVIGPHGPIDERSRSANLRFLVQKKPAQPIRLGLEYTRVENALFYAYPISLPFSDSYTGYVAAESNIGPQLLQVQRDLYKNLALSLLALAVIGFLAYRALKRILYLEVRSKKKLFEYANLAKARKEELETLSFVISKSDNLILLTDYAGKILWLNESYTRKNNYSNEELENFLGKELAEVSHYPKIQEIIDEVVATKKKLEYEAKSYDSDGNEFWASTTVTPILDAEGSVEKLLFIDADITRLKVAEREIAKMANFAQENSKPLIRIDLTGRVIFSNEPGQIILQHWNAKVNERIDRPQVRDTISGVYESGFEKAINIEHNNRIFNLRFFPVKEKEYVNVYGEDITEVKIAERKSFEKALKLEQHNLNITDSINYARRIQQALIPGEDQIRKFFKNSFVINKPKDIVSGDFLWMYELQPKTEYLIALADCTGHGVPGAMMSIIGHSLLNEIVEANGEYDPAKILEKLNVEVIRSLKQKTQTDTNDGMDVSILRIHLKDLSVTFAGAYQHVYWMNGRLNILKGDRQPIGGLHHNENRKFINHHFKVSKGDAIYLSSDGFIDQFGGPRNKKFMKHQLGELLETNHKYSMQAQSHVYEKAFEQWKGTQEQVDDVSLLGIKF